MTLRRTSSPILVNQPVALAEMVARLLDSSQIALDTESDSLYSYYPRVCLIQITLPQSTIPQSPGRAPQAESHLLDVADFIVDPLRLNDLSALNEVLADPAREVIMHAAENDILLLQRDFDFSFGRIFDTQLAARILGWPRAALAAILEEHFGVASDKRMQRTDWGKRPLTPEQIAYAQMDTHYLPALAAQQTAELMAADRWTEAQEAFGFLAQLDYQDREETERTVWQMKETRTVPREVTNVLQAVWNWREQEAKRRDRPPFKVLSNTAVINLALDQPRRLNDLRTIKGLTDYDIQRYGEQLLNAVEQGRRAPLPDLPESTRPEHIPDRELLARFDALRKWRTDTANARGVAPDIVLSNDLLMEIARRMPQTKAELCQIPQIGPWKAGAYGPAIFNILRRTRSS